MLEEQTKTLVDSQTLLQLVQHLLLGVLLLFRLCNSSESLARPCNSSLSTINSLTSHELFEFGAFLLVPLEKLLQDRLFLHFL